MATLHIDAEMPDSELKGFLRLLRSWDAGREEVVLRISGLAPSLSVEEIGAMLDELEPPALFIAKFDRSGN